MEIILFHPIWGEILIGWGWGGVAFYCLGWEWGGVSKSCPMTSLIIPQELKQW